LNSSIHRFEEINHYKFFFTHSKTLKKVFFFSLYVSKHKYKNALNFLYATLNIYLIFKQHLDS